jgi:hypothetical protein
VNHELAVVLLPLFEGFFGRDGERQRGTIGVLVIVVAVDLIHAVSGEVGGNVCKRLVVVPIAKSIGDILECLLELIVIRVLALDNVWAKRIFALPAGPSSTRLWVIQRKDLHV